MKLSYATVRVLVAFLCLGVVERKTFFGMFIKLVSICTDRAANNSLFLRRDTAKML